MCNLSQGIAERAAEEATLIATEKTMERFIKTMNENKFTLEQIALATGKTIKEIEDVLQRG